MADKEVMAEAASALIRSYEVAGGDTSDAGLRAGYATHALHPHIPDGGHPGRAGLTIGHGHDLGYATKQEIDDVYGPVGPDGPRREILTREQRERLKQFAGKRVYKKKEKAAALTATRDIMMTYEQAVDVFEKELLVRKGITPARNAYPGFDALPPLQQAAIVDRTYMRGSGPNPTEGKLGAQLWTELKDAIMTRNTLRVHAVLKRMEALHADNALPSSTQGRARKRADMAFKGYMSEQETGEVPWSPIG